MAKKTKNCIIHALPVLTDNIIWIWERGREAVVVDPSVSDPVVEFLDKNNLSLNCVLQTHHHDDHIGGTKSLITRWPSTPVIASKEDLDRIPFQSYSVQDDDELRILGCKVKVLALPGHTKAHIAFYSSGIKNEDTEPIIFCGDTLFSGGCGRLFEGSPKEMFYSLKKINSLPSQTKIYCAHEYTESNLRWANNLLPEDLLIKKRLEKVIEIRANGLPTLPSTLEEERKTNLFLRSKSVDEFYRLRKHKDNWNG
ncbi:MULTISPECIES: hydroxyacylglutathione hydrolase [Prochlorococcus]|uniref:hydroxyacylglutathione hydrolase n=1 Tax=Prochlorococcus TaxID=1218 RepID=UPI0005634308|nr:MULTISPECIES: hydroxyacylglutathione hydrolase [Prochlorococcus]